MSDDELRERVRADVKLHGWHVVKVMGDEVLPGWAYTVGVHEGWAHPEIAVFGLDLEPMHELLNHLAGIVRSGRRFEPEHEYEGVFEGYRCAIRPVQPVWVDVFFGNAAWYYESLDVPFLQCFWPDSEARFPWEPEFAFGLREAQPHLYLADPREALSTLWRETLAREGALDTPSS